MSRPRLMRPLAAATLLLLALGAALLYACRDKPTEPLYPRLFVAPDGRVFAAGPDEATYYLNTSGTGSWTGGSVSKVARNYGSAVMYDAGKILIVGGN
jgi:hypothetical protein